MGITNDNGGQGHKKSKDNRKKHKYSSTSGNNNQEIINKSQ